MNKKSPSVAPATEIVVSLLAQYADEHNSRQLRSDPRSYIYKTTQINIPDDVDVAVVQNSGVMVNLILPYYDAVGKRPSQPIDTEDMALVSGGFWYFEDTPLYVGGGYGGVSSAYYLGQQMSAYEGFPY